MQNPDQDPSTLTFYTNTLKKQVRQEDSYLPQCRICLQQMREQPELQYCQCRGNLKYVHQECLLQWTNRTKIHSQGKTKYCFCQICKGRILLQVSSKLTFLSLAQICNSIFCNPVMPQRIKRVLLLLFLTILLTSEVIQVAIYLNEPDGRGTKVLIALISINSFLLFIGSLYFLFKYLLSNKLKVNEIKGVAVGRQSSQKIITNNESSQK